MSGHSKWANIKNRKGAQDKKRSETFTKISKLILTAVRQGGGKTDPEVNAYLKVALEKAREASMPKDNIERLLSSFEERRARLASYIFEGFGPFGVPLIIEVESDNKNRAIGEIKSILNSYGGNLGESGSVAFMFEKVGEIETTTMSEASQLALIDMGAGDFDGEVVLVDSHRLETMRKAMEEAGFVVKRAEVVMRCKVPVVLEKEEEVEKIIELVEELEENEDIVTVYVGMDYAEKV